VSDAEQYDELEPEMDDDLFAEGEPGHGFDAHPGDYEGADESDDDDGADWDED
jgi:hypothetical protein